MLTHVFRHKISVPENVSVELLRRILRNVALAASSTQRVRRPKWRGSINQDSSTARFPVPVPKLGRLRRAAAAVHAKVCFPNVVIGLINFARACSGIVAISAQIRR